MTFDAGTITATLVGGLMLHGIVQSLLGAFRHTQTVAKLEARLDGVDKTLDRLEKIIIENACHATGSECAAGSPMMFRKVEKVQ